jgi:hypothetical protein
MTRSPFDYPLVSGDYQMSDDWRISLPPIEFRRRFEDDSLVIWRPGITAWISIWGAGKGNVRERVERRRSSISPGAYDLLEESFHGGVRFSYRLREEPSVEESDLRDPQAPALYGFVFSVSGEVQMGIYFDDADDVALGMALWRGVHEQPVA